MDSGVQTDTAMQVVLAVMGTVVGVLLAGLGLTMATAQDGPPPLLLLFIGFSAGVTLTGAASEWWSILRRRLVHQKPVGPGQPPQR